MIARTLKIQDLSNVVGCTRHVMRGFLKEVLLKPALSPEGLKKSIQKFSAQELLIIIICFEIEFRYGVKRSCIAKLYPIIMDLVSKPRSIAVDAKLVIRLSPIKVQYFDGAADFSEGLLVPLMNIFEKVDNYLLPGRSSLSSNRQGYLDLGPVQISTNKSSHSVSRQYKKLAGDRNE